MKRYREPLFVLALLVVPFVFFAANAKKDRTPNLLDRMVLAASAPIQTAIRAAFYGVADTWGSYVSLRGVREENERLRRRILRLEADNHVLAERAREADRLKELLSFQESRPEARFVAARVVAFGQSAAVRTIRIGKGLSDGVARGMPVLTAAGVVGTVTGATGSTADVRLLVDPNSVVAVQVARSRARANVRGLGTNDLARLKLDYMLRTDDLEEGDELVTSGTDGIFPKGLRLGRVTNIRRLPYGLYQAADVVPAVEFAKLDEVLVMVSGAGEGPSVAK